MKRIALIGDYNPDVTAHQAIPLALAAAARDTGVDVAWDWVETKTIGPDVKATLRDCAGVWCVPNSPYANTSGAMAAIRLARENGIPYLGTCGGFQYALLEFAESVWQLDRPAHAETDPDARDPVISALECSLVEVTDHLRFVPGTRLGRIYGAASATEGYHCRYGLNPVHAERLIQGPLRVSALDDQGEVRAVELDGHPFFIATLFQPERAALRGQTPPLVSAFVRAL
ncbi:MAG: gamma-glutamyl-gamma-aminobutyrate hydrolase family protein [Gammaproteobacteria bacterium]|nr:gamma-glutamyl-gamma-aminobutyrate hydrolase family protein [Gammaproteobacteria bacterium]